MATPKKRMSQTRTAKRRSHHALKNVESLARGNAHRLKKFFARKAAISTPAESPVTEA